MYCWVEYPQMAHQENCDCCRCIQIPQKPYEECVCDDTQQVETNSNPLIYHHYYQTPCTVCGRTHYQQSTSVCGVLPLECDCKDMSSFFSTTSPRLSSFSNKTDITKKSVQYADNCTLQGSRKSMSARNDDGFFPAPPSKKTLGLQTCKDTGVGDCPACLGARTSCHQSECQLCCEPKTCGPEYSKCPFAPAIEVQTDPICEFSQLPCRCSGRDTCGLPPCGVAETCEYSDIECRCPAKSCNLKGSCIIIDEGDEDFYHFSQINCDCADIGCDTSGNCIEFDSICECGPQPFEVYNTVDEDYDGQDFYETYASQGVFDDFPKQSISCQADPSQPPAASLSKVLTQQQMQMAVANVLGRQSVAQRKSCAADTPLFPPADPFAVRQSMAARPSMMRKSTSAGPWVDPAMARQSQMLRQSVAANMRQSVSPNMRMSVSPNMRMSVSPNMRQSVAPSMRQSVAAGMRQSMAPSMRQSMAPSMRQSMAPDVFGGTQSQVMGASFMSGMDGFPGIVERRRYCAQGRYVGPGADIPLDTLSLGSQRHSAFEEEPIYSNLDIMRQLMEPPTTDCTETDDDALMGTASPDAELQTDDENNGYDNADDGDGVYEVIIDQVPNEHGTTNRISIVSPGAKEKPNPGSANVTKATSCSKLQATKSDVSTQIRDARTNPQPQGSKMNPAVTSTTKIPRTHNLAQRTASTKSLLKHTSSTRSIDPSKPKSQVHFDINILDANNANRMIVLRRSISQQTKP